MNAEIINLHPDVENDRDDAMIKLRSEKEMKRRRYEFERDQFEAQAVGQKSINKVYESEKLLGEARKREVVCRLIELSLANLNIISPDGSHSNQNSARQ